MMRPLSAAELLDLWERGQFQMPHQWALSALALALPDVEPTALGALTIGQRDRTLWALREGLFGAEYVGIVGCPRCGEQLEFAFQASDIYPAPPVHPERVVEAADVQGTYRFSAEGYSVTFRPPNCQDLAAVAGETSVGAARNLLLERCVLDISHEAGDGKALSRDLPEALVSAIAAHMADVDPAADTRITLVCPACEHTWQAAFDIVSYLWRELNNWAGRMLQEVHVLASAYGWREADILALSPFRRRAYLQMVSGDV